MAWVLAYVPDGLFYSSWRVLEIVRLCSFLGVVTSNVTVFAVCSRKQLSPASS